MPVKVMWGLDGPYAVADTPREALELIKLGSNGFSHKQSTIEDTSPITKHDNGDLDVLKPEEERCALLFAGINERAQRLLAAIRNHKDGVNGDRLSEEIDEESSAFGGILGGVSKIAAKNNLDFEKLVFSEMRVEGTKRFRFFRPESLLLKHGHLLKPRYPRERTAVEEGR